MTRSRCALTTLPLLAFLLALTSPTPAAAGGFVVLNVGFQVLELTPTHQSTVVVAQFQYQGPKDSDDDNCAINTGLKIGNGAWRNGNGRHCQPSQITPGYVISCGLPYGCGAADNIPRCTNGQDTQYTGRGSAVIFKPSWSGNEFTPPKYQSARTTCPSPPPPPSEPVCECSSPSQCQDRYGNPPDGGTWNCNCLCFPNQSPLVVHLPDYFESGGGNQSWWRQGFCTAEAPTVCLDWRGDRELVCTSWTAPGSDIAFVVSLSNDDMLRLGEGLLPLYAEPYRHFFGNVTLGPEGDSPYANGFEALAAYCGQDPEAGEIDLTECGSSLHVWADLSADGVIGIDELVELRDLGVEYLGNTRETGKQDRCGNTFSPEAHATCADRPGRCGTWLDVFFVVR